MKKIYWFLVLLCSVQILLPAKAQELFLQERDIIHRCKMKGEDIDAVQSLIDEGKVRVKPEFIVQFLVEVYREKQSYDQGVISKGIVSHQVFLKRVCDVLYAVLKKYPDFDLNLEVKGLTALILACAMQNLKIVQLFLRQQNINPNLVTPEPEKAALYQACKDYNPAIVAEFLNDPRVNVNVAAGRGYTPLLFACDHNNFELAQQLLGHPDIDTNCQTTDGFTPLMVVCESKVAESEDVAKRRVALAHLLLTAPTKIPVDVNAVNHRHESALLFACISNNPEKVAALLRHPTINVNVVTQLGWTVLAIMCTPLALKLKDSAQTRSRQLAIVRLLLGAADIDLNILCGGRSAIMHAAANDFYEIFALLRSDQRIKINMQDYQTDTVLMFLCHHSLSPDRILQFIELLLNPELSPVVDVNIQDKFGCTALMIAAETGFLHGVERLLQQPGIEVALRNMWGELALTYASTPKMYRALYNAGIYTLQDLCEALDLALVKSYTKIIFMILDDLAKLHVSDEDIAAKIMQIHREKQQDISEKSLNPWKDNSLIGSFLKSKNVALMNRFMPLLLRASQDVQNIDLDGNSLLHLALKYTVPQEISKSIAEKMSLETLQLQNNDGYTALTFSEKLHQDGIKKYLEERLMPEQVAMAEAPSTPTTVSQETVAKHDVSVQQDLPVQAKKSAKKAKAKSVPSESVAKAIPQKVVPTQGELFLKFREQLQAINQKLVRIPVRYQINVVNLLGYKNVMVDFNHILKINVRGNSEHGVLSLTLQGAHFDPVIQRCIQNNLISVEHKIDQKNGSSIVYSLKNNITQDIAIKTVFASSLTVDQICQAILSAEFIEKIQEAGEQDSDVDVVVAKAIFKVNSKAQVLFIKCVLERNFSESVHWQLKTAYPLTDQEASKYEVLKA